MSFLLDFKDRIMEDAAIDDGVDRMNRQYTVILFLIILIFLGLKQFVGDPIECFTPQYFSGAQEQYVNAYCWTASTYQVMAKDYNPFRPFKNTDVLLKGRAAGGQVDHEFPESELTGHKEYISYYQWIPIIISVQAFLFYAPHLMWLALASQSGVHIKGFMSGARGLGNLGKKSEREELLEDLAEQFKRYIKVTRKLSSKSCGLPADRMFFSFGMKNGNFLCVWYIIVKIIFVINVILQLIGLHYFLNVNIILHGFNVVKGIIFDSDWTESPRFPINTICEFRGQPQLHGYLLSYTCHCVLPINLYNDKIYAIVSLYLLMLAIATVFSFLHWFRKVVDLEFGSKFILRYLRVNDRKRQAEEEGIWKATWDSFLSKSLRKDGIFIMMLVEINLGEVTADHLIVKLWDDAFEDWKRLNVRNGSKTPSVRPNQLSPNIPLTPDNDSPKKNNNNPKKFPLYPATFTANNGPSAPFNGIDEPDVRVPMPL